MDSIEKRCLMDSIEKRIVAEVLARLHKQGLFKTDGMRQEAIDFTLEHLEIGVRLVLDGPPTSRRD